ncbi:MAG: phosphoheptose isomerase [Flavobacteriales bacterium]|nr:phosphoheptose isomerase [Flavobacteriales bacterium]|tara:strand:- start:12383 stop:12943 length:561 start_codon:yes stop_codon:yes gene_type:complete
MFSTYLSKFNTVLGQTEATNNQENSIGLDEAFGQVNELFNVVKNNRKNIYLIGNGGSSGIVSHGAIDFLNACGFKARALTDNSMLTCIANDYGYENVFAQPFKTLIEEGDAVIAISSSGKSENIVNACKVARSMGAKVVTFSGFKGGNPLRKEGDFNFWLDSSNYGIVEIGHSLLLHHITDQLSIK